ncbi:unnamed protein product, partial [Leptidea sinapis]
YELFHRQYNLGATY